MLHLPNITSDRLELNALFIQPTRWCARNCKGCYVKEHESTEEQVSLPTLSTLVEECYIGESITTNQLTISVDDAPETDEGKLMQSFVDTVIDIASLYNKKRTRPQLHLTMHAENTYKQYFGNFPNHTGLHEVKVFSFSTISDPDSLRETVGTAHINYNHMPPSNITSDNLDKHVERLTQIGKAVNSIYMIMFKSPVGAERNDLVQLKDRARMRSDVLYMKTMWERLPEDIKKKIVVDGCLQDTVNSLSTGYGCSSNVSRFQVWPDGSVSGCPYAVSPNTGPATSAGEIVENIREARKQYDFRRCHLPEVHTSLLKRPKDPPPALPPR